MDGVGSLLTASGLCCGGLSSLPLPANPARRPPQSQVESSRVGLVFPPEDPYPTSRAALEYLMYVHILGTVDTEVLRAGVLNCGCVYTQDSILNAVLHAARVTRCQDDCFALLG